MKLETLLKEFVNCPFPLWETDLTHELVLHKWQELEQIGLSNQDAYTTEKIWLQNLALETGKKILLIEDEGKNIYVETPSILLKSFYEEHGLELLNADELESELALKKLQNALLILKQIKPAYDCVVNVVRTIQVLRNDNAEIDLSYSHPKIPFSIFVSVCEDDSEVSNLRVAESILHEAMHLKLTLIENVVPLIEPNNRTLYYSPWKDEERHTQGVLHGLFVFRAIGELYAIILNSFQEQNTRNFIKNRIEQIRSEILLLNDFHNHCGLSQMGNRLTFNLIQY